MSVRDPAPTPTRGEGAAEPLLRGLFDHAGMFPPAQLPLDVALRDAARFGQVLRRPGILGADLVVPFNQFAGLDAAALSAAGFAKAPCKVAIVGVAMDQAEAAQQAAAKANAAGGPVRVLSVEVHFEGTAPASWPAAHKAFTTYLEPKWSPPQWQAGVPGLCHELKRRGLGLKFRCAGPTAVDRPALAAIVRAASDACIPLKATQGLHHPVATPRSPHGFVALAAAVRLRQQHHARFDDVEACLGEPSAAAFRLADGIRWGKHEVDAPSLAALPSFAIGSCSLTEPDEDLMAAYGKTA